MKRLNSSNPFWHYLKKLKETSAQIHKCAAPRIRRILAHDLFNLLMTRCSRREAGRVAHVLTGIKPSVWRTRAKHATISN